MLAGFSHIALTVTDVQVSRRFYEDVLGMRVLDSNATYCALLTGSPHLSALILTSHDDPSEGPFNEFRIGLDHISFAVPDVPSLTAWQARLREHQVRFDLRHSEWGHHLNFRDPDNIAVEMVVLEPDEHIRGIVDRQASSAGQ